jgi:pyridoxal phosphate enzyme (YggS family)
MRLNEAYHYVQETIAEACRLAGRERHTVQLLAVSKSRHWPEIAPLYHLGQRDFAENRLPEGLQKKAVAPNDCRWHWIGSLQKNKVRKVVGEFVLIHSVDSLELARKISQVSGEMGVVSRVLLQANVSGEASKHGLTGAEWKACVEELVGLPHLHIEGMMTMAAVDDDEYSARHCFASLRVLRDELLALVDGNLTLTELSMGMSRDFTWAIQEGATIVRVGSLFWEH